LKGDREVVMEAVKQDWRALQYANREVALAAVRQYLQEVFREFVCAISLCTSPQVDPEKTYL